jgi:hypothetical protein
VTLLLAPLEAFAPMLLQCVVPLLLPAPLLLLQVVVPFLPLLLVMQAAAPLLPLLLPMLLGSVPLQTEQEVSAGLEAVAPSAMLPAAASCSAAAAATTAAAVGPVLQLPPAAAAPAAAVGLRQGVMLLSS